MEEQVIPSSYDDPHSSHGIWSSTPNSLDLNYKRHFFDRFLLVPVYRQLILTALDQTDGSNQFRESNQCQVCSIFPQWAAEGGGKRKERKKMQACLHPTLLSKGKDEKTSWNIYPGRWKRLPSEGRGWNATVIPNAPRPGVLSGTEGSRGGQPPWWCQNKRSQGQHL